MKILKIATIGFLVLVAVACKKNDLKVSNSKAITAKTMDGTTDSTDVDSGGDDGPKLPPH